MSDASDAETRIIRKTKRKQEPVEEEEAVSDNLESPPPALKKQRKSKGKQKETDSDSKCGNIEKISLVNFMCHSRLVQS